MLKLQDLKRKNFESRDFWYSKIAEKNDITNIPPLSALTGLMLLADKLQFIRDKINIPLIIFSAFRCHQLNRLVKGSPKSAHLQGLAADILFKDKSIEETCNLILQTGVVFDQLLLEPQKGIVHFGLKVRDKDCRHEVAIVEFDGKKWTKKLI